MLLGTVKATINGRPLGKQLKKYDKISLVLGRESINFNKNRS